MTNDDIPDRLKHGECDPYADPYDWEEPEDYEENEYQFYLGI